ncbi:MAG: hypothetical protein AMS18_00090 [Gemmatimonas sp. SG8_17]|nr:MAG: hypothetical protein AMS18_00090 [Gemmatimonas sp. SG8_17]
MVPPAVAAAGIMAGGQLLGGLFGGGGGIGKDEIKMILRRQTEQERRRAKEFAAGLPEYEAMAERFGGLSSDYLTQGARTMRDYLGGLSDIETDITTRLQDRIAGIQGETQTMLGEYMRSFLPEAQRAGVMRGFSPRGGATSRAIGEMAERGAQTAGEYASSRLQQAMFDVIPAQMQLAGMRGAAGQWQSEMGMGALGSEASLRESIFGARMNTPYATEALEQGEDFQVSSGWGSRLADFIRKRALK